MNAEWLSAAEVATRVGICETTWRGYISRGHPRGNPAPRHGRRNPVTGVQEWDGAVVGAWIACRDGRGRRTDLTN